MFRLFYPGQPVPSWLVEQRKRSHHSREGTMTFTVLTVVYNRNKAYHVRKILGPLKEGGCSMKYKDAFDMDLIFKSPSKENNPVHMPVDPLISYYEIFCAMSLFLGTMYLI